MGVINIVTIECFKSVCVMSTFKILVMYVYTTLFIYICVCMFVVCMFVVCMSVMVGVTVCVCVCVSVCQYVCM